LQLRPEQVRIADQAVRQWRPKPLDPDVNEVRPAAWQRADAARGSSPGTTLVFRVQSLLNKLGYDAGVPDGLAGPQTVAAVRRCQTRLGLALDGAVTESLLERLEALAS
jgi:localization factor PodJL